ncbi:uncharacterized protein LOC127749426 [Frankliniella occidentalis]|uniref:Uncharacterized protein LOC127749426 n=1 Tax=Frankliniella occidentalis TaxID=133901 RepID=A0A9C6U5L6_FRAOC|nr:uncharacterized protein LOC127749426 [Frankliniella occidentalis]
MLQCKIKVSGKFLKASGITCPRSPSTWWGPSTKLRPRRRLWRRTSPRTSPGPTPGEYRGLFTFSEKASSPRRRPPPALISTRTTSSRVTEENVPLMSCKQGLQGSQA